MAASLLAPSWGFNAHRNRTHLHGGKTSAPVVGSAEEASEYTAYPEYEVNYLRQKLAADSKLGAMVSAHATPTAHWAGGDVGKQTFLDKVTANYKSEADQCLKNEFSEWLMGRHPANSWAEQNKTWNEDVGKEKPDAPKRYQWGYHAGSVNPDEDKKMQKDDWVSTPWGKAQLTHLPGVRDKLREDHEAVKKAQHQMNLLAEFGPQNLDEAWMYFKHWVKGRPITAECFPASELVTSKSGHDGTVDPEEVERANFEHQPPMRDMDRLDGLVDADWVLKYKPPSSTYTPYGGPGLPFGNVETPGEWIYEDQWSGGTRRSRPERIMPDPYAGAADAAVPPPLPVPRVITDPGSVMTVSEVEQPVQIRNTVDPAVPPLQITGDASRPLPVDFSSMPAPPAPPAPVVNVNPAPVIIRGGGGSLPIRAGPTPRTGFADAGRSLGEPPPTPYQRGEYPLPGRRDEQRADELASLKASRDALAALEAGTYVAPSTDFPTGTDLGPQFEQVGERRGRRIRVQSAAGAAAGLAPG